MTCISLETTKWSRRPPLGPLPETHQSPTPFQLPALPSTHPKSIIPLSSTTTVSCNSAQVPTPPLSSPCSPVAGSSPHSNIWDDALHAPRPVKTLYSWDTPRASFIYQPNTLPDQVPRFFSELCTTDVFHDLYLGHINLPLLYKEPCIIITEEQLYSAVLAMMHGHSTSLFTLDLATRAFSFTSRATRLKKYGQRSLQRALTRFIHLGTTLVRLQHVSTTMETNHGVWGITGAAFGATLGSYLTLCRGLIAHQFEQLQHKGQLSLCTVYHHISNIHRIVHQLAVMCRCSHNSEPSTSWKSAQREAYLTHGFYLPEGVSLVTHVYRTLQRFQLSGADTLLLSVVWILLIDSSQPLFSWLVRWLNAPENMVTLDPSGEFYGAFHAYLTFCTQSTDSSSLQASPSATALFSGSQRAESLPELPDFFTLEHVQAILDTGRLLHWLRTHLPKFFKDADLFLFPQNGPRLHWFPPCSNSKAECEWMFDPPATATIPHGPSCNILDVTTFPKPHLLTGITTTSAISQRLWDVFQQQGTSRAYPLPIQAERQILTPLYRHIECYNRHILQWLLVHSQLAQHCHRAVTISLLQHGTWWENMQGLLFDDMPLFIKDRHEKPIYHLRQKVPPAQPCASPGSVSALLDEFSVMSVGASPQRVPERGTRSRPVYLSGAKLYAVALARLRHRVYQVLQDTPDVLPPSSGAGSPNSTSIAPVGNLDQYVMVTGSTRFDPNYFNVFSPVAYGFLRLKYQWPMALTMFNGKSVGEKLDKLFGGAVQLAWVTYRVKELSRRIFTSPLLRKYRAYTSSPISQKRQQLALNPSWTDRSRYAVVVIRLHHEIHHFLTAFNQYVQDVVYGRTWMRFQQLLDLLQRQVIDPSSLPGSPTCPSFPGFGDFLAYYVSTLDTMLYQMLQRSSLRLLNKTLTGIFEVILRFCKQLEIDLLVLDSFQLDSAEKPQVSIDAMTDLQDEYRIELQAFCQQLAKAAQRRAEVTTAIPISLEKHLQRLNGRGPEMQADIIGYHPFMDLLSHLDYSDYYNFC
ncbi:hypothetical protein IWQ62_004664 [Dispira parvispora]|uniref:Spindle pole body component n=1 Tax=Dispira parvispora TaxID=1520584 RepID=A0A9W8ARF7_9FUNG|nr:hypothetical protein IWQ62_004664 [Dispira parvispora]